MTCTVIGLPIGSNAVYGFVFKDDLEAPIDLAGSEFIVRLAAKYPKLAMEFATTTSPDNLYIEESATIDPVDAPAYIADRLVLALPPSITRQIPLGALTNWEIERRSNGDQRNWGTGLFSGYGGINPDGPPVTPVIPAEADGAFRFNLADDATQTFAIPAIAPGALVRVEVYSTAAPSYDWFADMLVDGAAATIAVEMGIVEHVTVQLSAALGVSDPDGSLNIALDVPGQLKVRNRTGAPAQGVVTLTL